MSARPPSANGGLDHRARDGVRLELLVRVLSRSKWLIAVCGLLGALALTAHVLLATPVYRTEALVTIADEAAEGPQSLGAVGALASLTGINLNGSTNRR